jgi:putative DNA primase/helicase
LGRPSTSERQELAQQYIENGWAIIPVPFGKKTPVLNEWQKRTITVDDVPRYWSNGQNIGVLTGEPSKWLVDIDLDQPEALRVAPHILPETRTSGHEGKMDSHWWYYATSLLKSRSFYVDIPGDEEERPVLETRANGRQTLIPCSTHPSGSKYVWCNRESIHRLPGEELGVFAEDVAVAGLLLRHYPKMGKRHTFALAATGLLVRHVGPERAERTMQAVVFASGDEEANSRLGDISDTIEAFSNGEEITGGPTLEDLLGGPGIVNRLQKWGVVSKDRVGGEAQAKASKAKPTDDELRDRWRAQNPDHAHGLGEWRRYDRGIWPVVKNEVIRRPMVRILEGAKDEGINPNVFLLNSVHELARLECYVEDDRWDSNPDIIVAENGAIEISTGKRLPHSKDHYATTRVPYAYDPDAEPQCWGKFIGDIERDVAAFLQEYAGYSLTTDTSHEKALWLIGQPGGGKALSLRG